ncbi:MAG: PD40 domain-containing protein, partial [Acidobacteria bacterium]|nr:PD40 domain-containing protein [Acidobacteriota bacterium]
MTTLRTLLAGLWLAGASFAATFGSVVPLVGGASDLVWDEPRGRLYLVNLNSNRVDVYAVARRTFLNAIRTDARPVSAAMSRNGKFLYVTCFDQSSLNVIDLDTSTVVRRINLPAKPEGVAAGADGRALITTIGTGQGNAFNNLLIYDPSAAAGNEITGVPIVAPPPAPPVAPPLGRPAYSTRSALQATNDGRYIIGVNNINANTRFVFVYEAASGTVLRARTAGNVSNVLSVSPDGSKFMAGLTLFETDTLSVLAQQNAANAPFSFPGGAANNFNTQQNQGGSVFSPDGQTLYSAFNIAPVQNPAARPNVSRLLLNDTDNLLISLGLQLTENLAGRMVTTNDGSTVFGLSESGFVILPVNQILQNPIAVPESPVVLLANDQCGVVADKRAAGVPVTNAGRGRLTASAQLLQLPAAPGGLGGVGGPGGGGPGGGII